MSALSIGEINSRLQRHPFSVVCGGLALLSTMAAVYFWNEVGDLDELRAAREADGAAALEKMVSGPPLRQELAAVREATLRIEDNLVIEDNLAENLWYFYKLEDQTKVKLLDIHQLNTITPESGALYRRVPYSLTIAGTYAQTASFLRALETGSHLANITFFSFKRHEAEGPGVVTLDLNLELLGKK